MIRWFWREGRFSWALVGTVVFLTVSVLIADYAWRVIVVPVDTFALYAIAADIVAAAILIALTTAIRRRAGTPKF